jgi:cell division protein FtsL
MKTTLTKTEKYSYSIIVGAVLLLLVFLISCSARTVTKQEDKKDSIAKTTESAKVAINETVKEVSKSDSSSTTKKEQEFKSFLDEFEFESVNPEKESSITQNGKTTTFKNLKGKKRNQVITDKNNSLESVNLIKSKDSELRRKNQLIMDKNIEIQKLQSQLSKHTEKKALISWWVWLLLFILLCVAGRVAWLYYKGVNPFGWVLKLFKR